MPISETARRVLTLIERQHLITAKEIANELRLPYEEVTRVWLPELQRMGVAYLKDDIWMPTLKAYGFDEPDTRIPGLPQARAEQNRYESFVRSSHLCQYLKRQISDEEAESDDYLHVFEEFKEMAYGRESSSFLMSVDTQWSELAQAQRKEKELLEKLYKSICEER